MASVWLTPRWPDFGRMTLSDNERQRKPLRAVLAGQPPSAQVTDARGTVYGSDCHRTGSSEVAGELRTSILL